MKKLELQNFGVVEIDAKEQISVDGGGFWEALAGITLGTIAFCYSVGKDCAESDRRAAAQK